MIFLAPRVLTGHMPKQKTMINENRIPVRLGNMMNCNHHKPLWLTMILRHCPSPNSPKNINKHRARHLAPSDNLAWKRGKEHRVWIIYLPGMAIIRPAMLDDWAGTNSRVARRRNDWWHKQPYERFSNDGERATAGQIPMITAVCFDAEGLIRRLGMIRQVMFLNLITASGRSGQWFNDRWLHHWFTSKRCVNSENVSTCVMSASVITSTNENDHHHAAPHCTAPSYSCLSDGRPIGLCQGKTRHDPHQVAG